MNIPVPNLEEVRDKFKAKLTTAENRVISKGIYFQPHAETKILNQKQMIRNKGFFLPNGNKCPEEKLNGNRVYVQNTCGFDLIIHILQFAALDNPTYLAYVQNSVNQTLTFLNNFITTGPKSHLCATIQTTQTILSNRERQKSLCA